MPVVCPYIRLQIDIMAGAKARRIPIFMRHSMQALSFNPTSQAALFPHRRGVSVQKIILVGKTLRIIVTNGEGRKWEFGTHPEMYSGIYPGNYSAIYPKVN